MELETLNEVHRKIHIKRSRWEERILGKERLRREALRRVKK